MISKLRTLLRMDAGFIGTVAHAWLVLAGVRFHTALPYRLWQDALRRAVTRPGVPGGGRAPEPRLLRAFRIALRNQPGRPSCLRRALALNSLLRSHGCPACVVIGVARAGDGLEAHAWIEIDGTVIEDAPDVARRFAPITESAGGMLPPRLARDILAAR